MNVNKEYFNGKTAAITRGTSEIGLAIAEELLAYGAAKIVLIDSNKTSLEVHEKHFSKSYGNKVKCIFCDITLEDHVKSMLHEAHTFFEDKFDILINCTGTGCMASFIPPEVLNHNFEKTPDIKALTNEDWKTAFSLNFYAPLYACKWVIPLMKTQGSGQIVNIIPNSTFSPMPYQAISSATSAALNGLTLSLRSEYWDSNIKINSATPGTAASGSWENKAFMPTFSQTPQQCAQSILAGMAKNQRLIFADSNDENGARCCFIPEAQNALDGYLRDILHSLQSSKKLM